jgi:hypothetical protein
MDVDTLRQSKYFSDLVTLVNQELGRTRQTSQDERPALEHELAALDSQIRGWRQSLGDPGLPVRTRSMLTQDVEQAAEKQEAIRDKLARLTSENTTVETLVDPLQVAEALTRLEEILLWENPTASNLELSLHVDKIECHPGGRVTVRTSKLGALAPLVEQFSEFEGSSDVPSTDVTSAKVKNRRRARLRVDDVGRDELEIRAKADYVADPHRFAGLGPEWFWQDDFQIPDPPLPWPEANAAAVLEKRKETGWSYPRLAEHYEVSIGTIKTAMKLGKAKCADPASLPKRARRPRWEELNWEKVLDRKRSVPPAEGTKVALARYFDVSPPTIGKALDLGAKYEEADAKLDTPDPDLGAETAA